EITLLKLKSLIAYEISEDDLGLEVCETALDKYPDEFDMLNNKTIFLGRLNRIEEALETGKKLVTYGQDVGNYHDTYGEVLMWARRYEEAIKEFKTALELNPTGWYVFDTYRKLGRTYEALGNDEKAKQCFERIDKIKSKKLPSERLLFKDVSED
ncbi:MAG: tetratricopeptide repeat protein, partial [Promethearchaeota archaeon]